MVWILCLTTLYMYYLAGLFIMAPASNCGIKWYHGMIVPREHTALAATLGKPSAS